MEKIIPANFYGPRAYFTDFDYKIVRQKHDKNKFRKEIERKLKIILLTKNTVVCAASHLTHEFAYNLFKDNPILLNNEMIIPALRKDKEHVIDYLDTKKIKKFLKIDMIAFYKENINKVVNWEVIDNSSWFKNNLVKELKNENSIIRRNLTNMPHKTLFFLITQLESQQVLSREFIITTISILPKNEQKILLNFVNLIYHISGARVVNCESALPQENYIDYSLADIEHRQILLSELQIFYKIFLELAFETMHKRAIPLELIDLLSFKDIYELRRPIENSSFRNSYEELVRKSTEFVNKNSYEGFLYNIQELLLIKNKITKEFEVIFEKELKNLLKRKALGNVKVLGKNTLSIGLGTAGFFNPISAISNVGSLLLESPAFLINLNHSFRNLRALNNHNVYIQNKERILKNMIHHSEISDKSTLLDVINLLMDTISQKITF
ncbi:MAG: hypothetical protein WC614_07670 [bacterium]